MGKGEGAASSAGKESACSAEDPSSIPGSGRSTGKGTGYPFQCSWVSQLAQLVKNLPAKQDTPVQFLGQEDPLERDRLPTPVFLGFPCGSASKESAGNEGDLGSIPGLGRSPEKGMATHSSILAWRIPGTV